MKTVSGDDYMVPSDYGLGDVSWLQDRLGEKKGFLTDRQEAST